MNRIAAALLTVDLVTASWAWAPARAEDLAGGFADPPDSAKPRTWWHWTGGNVAKEGITKDLAR